MKLLIYRKGVLKIFLSFIYFMEFEIKITETRVHIGI